MAFHLDSDVCLSGQVVVENVHRLNIALLYLPILTKCLRIHAVMNGQQLAYYSKSRDAYGGRK